MRRINIISYILFFFFLSLINLVSLKYLLVDVLYKEESIHDKTLCHNL